MSGSKRIVLPTPEEEEAINKGIAEDPDTRVLTDEEWSRAKPLAEADPELFKSLKSSGGKVRVAQSKPGRATDVPRVKAHKKNA